MLRERASETSSVELSIHGLALRREPSIGRCARLWTGRLLAHRFGVIDLFAGPGGLGEGFAGLCREDRHPFDIVISAEKDAAAHATLRLRSFLRACVRETGSLPEPYLDHHSGRIPQPDWESIRPALWRRAEREARQLTLGEASAEERLNASIDCARRSFDDTVLIGGPPCQAYSLVGRARNRGVAGYSARDDHRHYLFRAYIEVLRRLRPAAFVMENVPGMLSPRWTGSACSRCFSRIWLLISTRN